MTNLQVLNRKEYQCAYPTVLTKGLTIPEASATASMFSRRGDYLAVGLFDGTVRVFDYDTFTCIRVLRKGHTKYNWKGDVYQPCISSVCWFSTEKHIITGAWDRRVCVWDLTTSKLVHRYKMNSGVKFVDCHPKTEAYLISPWWDVPYFVGSLKSKAKLRLPVEKNCKVIGGDYDHMVARFGRDGKYIYVGNSYGKVEIMTFKEPDEDEMDESEGVDDMGIPGKIEKVREINVADILGMQPSGKRRPAVHDLLFSKLGKLLLINIGHMLLLYSLEAQFLLGKFQDVVKTHEPIFQHNCMGFSGYEYRRKGSDLYAFGKRKVRNPDDPPELPKGLTAFDSRYVFASCRGSKQVYIWDCITFQLVHILVGMKENINSCIWHPREPDLLTSTTHNSVYVWQKEFTEGWTAIAPSFTPLRESIFYMEQEDEFDKVEDSKFLQKRLESKEILPEGKSIDLFSQPPSEYPSDNEEVEDELGNKVLRRKKDIFLNIDEGTISMWRVEYLFKNRKMLEAEKKKKKKGKKKNKPKKKKK